MNTPRKVGGSKPGERRGNAGKGRQKGVPNKTTKALKEMILGALSDAGGQHYLRQQASENPAAFLTLIGKVLPSEIKAEHSGPEGGPISINVRFIRPKPDAGS